jgi:hypothetical protein
MNAALKRSIVLPSGLKQNIDKTELKQTCWINNNEIVQQFDQLVKRRFS